MRKIIGGGINACTAILTRISPVLASRFFYAVRMKRVLHLDNPIDFSEKLMKLKLEQYNNNPIAWACADKLQVRDYVKKYGVSENNLPELLGVYNDANEIDFDKLPNKFALKSTHGAGFNIICTDKSKLDIERVRSVLNRWLTTRFGLKSAEIHYGKVKASIICEVFIEGEGGALPLDYKVYCFGGAPRYVMACTGRTNGVSKVNIMDLDWNDTGYIKEQFSSQSAVAKPNTLPEMLKMAESISKEFPFVRVDFYEDKGAAILGEMTFTPHACVNANMTDKGQKDLGKLIDLNYKAE